MHTEHSHIFPGNRFVRKLILLIGLLAFSQLTQAQSRINKVQQFSWVYYQYPAQFFMNGMKSGLDINVNDKLVLGLQYQSILSFNPLFYTVAVDNSTTSVEVTPNYKAETNLSVWLKNYIGKYGFTFHGTYVGVFGEIGRGNEAYYTQLAPGFKKVLITNQYKHKRVGLVLGKQWTVFNQGVVDLNLGIGFNNMPLGEEIKYDWLFSMFQPNRAYFLTNIGLGIGKWSNDQQLPRKPRLRDSLALYDAFLLDLNAVINSGMELNYYFNNSGKHLWRVYGRYRNNSNTVINISNADTSRSYMIGGQFRHYPRASLFRNGAFIGAGMSAEYTKNIFRNEIFRNGRVEETRTEEEHFPVNVDCTLGFTTILDHRYMLEAYLSNIFTLTNKGVDVPEYGRVNEALGVRTELGVKFGIARFTRK